MDGTLVYRNEAGHQIVQRWGLALGDTMPTELVSHAKTPNDEAIELAVGNRTYSFHVVAVPEIDSINVYGTDVCAKKTITKFPDQNPNPVLKTDMQGRLLYANGAGQQIQQTWDIPLGGQMPQAIVDHAETPDDEAVELAVGNRTFSFHVVGVPEFEFINIYGTDVTAKKAITKFPDQNPNPVLKTDMQGRLLTPMALDNKYASNGELNMESCCQVELSKLPQTVQMHP